MYALTLIIILFGSKKAAELMKIVPSKWKKLQNGCNHNVDTMTSRQSRGRYTYLSARVRAKRLSNSYTMGCPSVSGDNPRALASGLSYVQVDKHGITFLYHPHHCRPCTSRDISC